MCGDQVLCQPVIWLADINFHIKFQSP